jgi:hypothetical protein
MSINNKFLDKELYKKAFDEVSKIYKYPSAYRSMAIVKRYRELGGRIKDDDKTNGTSRWLMEAWINVDDYLQGIITPCGNKFKIKKSACRPSKRVSKETPPTIDELIEIHGKEKIQKAIDIKNKDPQNLIMDWIKLKVYPKKNK